MHELILRWSRDRGLFVVPGDNLVNETQNTVFKPLPFYISAADLGDPDLFNDAASDHGWPALSVARHQARLSSAITGLEVRGGIENLPAHLRVEIWKAVVRVIDALDPPQVCLERLERLAQ